MPDAILTIVTVQTVPGLKNLWTCPMTGSVPNAISTPINTTLLTVFIVGRFLGEDAVTATEGRRLPLHPGFYAAHECWGTVDVAARRLKAAERGSTAVGDSDRPPLWCLFNSAHRTALSRQPQDAFGCARVGSHLSTGRFRTAPQRRVFTWTFWSSSDGCGFGRHTGQFGKYLATTPE